MIGAQAAADRWRSIHQSIADLSDKIARLKIQCDWHRRPEIYLAGSILDPSALKAEAMARLNAGLPSRYAEAGEIASRFNIEPRAALISEDCFEVDPVALTHGLLRAAARAGATITFPLDIASIEHQSDSVILRTKSGATLTATRVILATGYEFPAWYLPNSFSLSSSFAIATEPQSDLGWKERAVIWEASSPYFYGRQAGDGRLIFGGEDDRSKDMSAAIARLPEKTIILERKASELCGRPIAADCAWGAVFGSSPDGLPAIGKARNAERIWLVSTFGGNGVTFASLAARLISDGMRREDSAGLRCFDPYRFEHADP